MSNVIQLFKPGMKVSFDFHGVLDDSPKFFSEFTHLLKKRDVEVHIVTGGEGKPELFAKLMLMGIHYDKFFSIVDHHKKMGSTVWYEDGKPYMSDEDWDPTKGRYCISNRINMHIDDTEAYAEYFDPAITKFVLWEPHSK